MADTQFQNYCNGTKFTTLDEVCNAYAFYLRFVAVSPARSSGPTVSWGQSQLNPRMMSSSGYSSDLLSPTHPNEDAATSKNGIKKTRKTRSKKKLSALNAKSLQVDAAFLEV